MEKLKYIKRDIKNGKEYFYFRKPNQKPIKINAEYGTPQFFLQYSQLLKNFAAINSTATPKSNNKNLENLIKDFKNSVRWIAFKPKTKEAYNNTFDRLTLPITPKDKSVNFDLGSIGINHKELKREIADEILRQFSIAKQPAQGNQVLKHLKALMKWSLGRSGWQLDFNPFSGYGNTPVDPDNQRPSDYRLITNGSIHNWTDQEIDLVKKHGCLGIQTMIELGRGLAQSNYDCMNLLWSNYKNGFFYFNREKTNAPIIVKANPRLKSFLDKLPKVGITIVMNHDYLGFNGTQSVGEFYTPTGELYQMKKEIRPFTQDLFYKKFQKTVKKAGLDSTKYKFHGLRYRGLTELAEAGCSVYEIMAISGHKSIAMIEKYTKKANQQANAERGLAKVEAFRKFNIV